MPEILTRVLARKAKTKVFEKCHVSEDLSTNINYDEPILLVSHYLPPVLSRKEVNFHLEGKMRRLSTYLFNRAMTHYRKLVWLGGEDEEEEGEEGEEEGEVEERGRDWGEKGGGIREGELGGSEGEGEGEEGREEGEVVARGGGGIKEDVGEKEEEEEGGRRRGRVVETGEEEEDAEKGEQKKLVGIEGLGEGEEIKVGVEVREAVEGGGFGVKAEGEGVEGGAGEGGIEGGGEVERAKLKKRCRTFHGGRKRMIQNVLSLLEKDMMVVLFGEEFKYLITWISEKFPKTKIALIISKNWKECEKWLEEKEEWEENATQSEEEERGGGGESGEGGGDERGRGREGGGGGEREEIERGKEEGREQRVRKDQARGVDKQDKNISEQKDQQTKKNEEEDIIKNNIKRKEERKKKDDGMRRPESQILIEESEGNLEETKKVREEGDRRRKEEDRRRENDSLKRISSPERWIFSTRLLWFMKSKQARSFLEQMEERNDLKTVCERGSFSLEGEAKVSIRIGYPGVDAVYLESLRKTGDFMTASGSFRSAYGNKKTMLMVETLGRCRKMVVSLHYLKQFLLETQNKFNLKIVMVVKRSGRREEGGRKGGKRKEGGGRSEEARREEGERGKKEEEGERKEERKGRREEEEEERMESSFNEDYQILKEKVNEINNMIFSDPYQNESFEQENPTIKLIEWRKKDCKGMRKRKKANGAGGKVKEGRKRREKEDDMKEERGGRRDGRNEGEEERRRKEECGVRKREIGRKREGRIKDEDDSGRKDEEGKRREKEGARRKKSWDEELNIFVYMANADIFMVNEDDLLSIMEFIVINEKNGMCLVERFGECQHNFGSVWGYNLWKYESFKEKLKGLLTLDPSIRANILSTDRNLIKKNSILNWFESVLLELKRSATTSTSNPIPKTHKSRSVNIFNVIDHYRSSNNRILILSQEAALNKSIPPSSSKASSSLHSALSKLASNSFNTFFMVSSSLTTSIPPPPSSLSLLLENGLYYKVPGQKKPLNILKPSFFPSPPPSSLYPPSSILPPPSSLTPPSLLPPLPIPPPTPPSYPLPSLPLSSSLLPPPPSSSILPPSSPSTSLPISPFPLPSSLPPSSSSPPPPSSYPLPPSSLPPPIKDWKQVVFQILDSFQKRTPKTKLLSKTGLVRWELAEAIKPLVEIQTREAERMIREKLKDEMERLEIIKDDKKFEVRPLGINKVLIEIDMKVKRFKG